ncbi:hypothetical protein [Sphaerisporangium perillae]|uniref:hypothetical protein n=1 Tax=Sphaerisporangium perillae TaxID=2935860 RepID=UPI002010B6CD|nr:hypothetical protein [Sphaerisporangium perillae]
MADALRARGADDTTARLAAEMGVLALTTAFARWAEPDNRQPYTEIAHAVLRDLQACATPLGTDADGRAWPRSPATAGARPLGQTRPHPLRGRS